MARKTSFAPKKAVQKTAISGVNGRTLHNKILLALPDRECAALFSKLEFVSLPTRTVLNEAGEVIKFAFFMDEGLASILTIMADGKSVEVGLCGAEGFIGLPLTAGFSTSPTRTIIQVAGTVSESALKTSLWRCVNVRNSR